jgi:hypothetical protein
MNTTPNFEPWNQLLHQYVDELGRVDYSWQAASQAALVDWLGEMASVEIRTWDRDTQLAYWINLYNALTINQVLRLYPIPSIQPEIFGVPNMVAFLRFFSRSAPPMDYSLNHVEHDILRPQFQDPRIHFALVCAAKGCPLLRNEAYVPERVQTQLEEDARRFITNPEKVRYESGVLYLSKIFKWYGGDFIPGFGSVTGYLQGFISVPIEAPIRYLPYDWSLNQRTSS